MSGGGNSDLYAFDASAASEAEKTAVELSVNAVADLLQSGKLSDQLTSKLIEAYMLSPSGRYPKITYTDGVVEDFNIEDEIYAQIDMLRRMRSKLTADAAGNFGEKVSFRDVKEVVSACSSVMGSLMKFHKDAKTIERNKAVETATITAMEKIADRYGDQQLISEFLTILQEELEKV